MAPDGGDFLAALRDRFLRRAAEELHALISALERLPQPS